MTTWLYRIGFLVVLVVVVIAGGLWVANKGLPQGKPGPEADALARKIEHAIRKDAWDKIGVVQWTYSGQRQHVWDRKRSLAQVIWKKGEYKALFAIAQPEAGQVFWRGKLVQDVKEQKKSLRRAFAYWANDSFWLNPLAKLFDAGTSRKIVTWEGKSQLLVTYSSGGVTPGDSYLYVLDKQFLPLRWHMWVKVLPVKGLAATFESWVTLPNGAKISTKHRVVTRNVVISELRTADTVQQLQQNDPFLPILTGHTSTSLSTSRATSRPAPSR